MFTHTYDTNLFHNTKIENIEFTSIIRTYSPHASPHMQTLRADTKLNPGDTVVATLEGARKFISERGITLNAHLPENASIGSRFCIHIGENSTGILTVHHISDAEQARGRTIRAHSHRDDTL